MELVRKIAGLLLLLFIADTAIADILTPWRYIKQYQLGFDVGNTTDNIEISFESESSHKTNSDMCIDIDNSSSRQCSLTFQQSSSNVGIFLQQPFKRQGLWHFDWDVAVGLRGLNGDFTPPKGDEEKYEDAPFQKVEVSLYSLYAYPYITLGITPKNWIPDVLLSLGFTGEAMFGSVRLDDEEYKNNGIFRRSSVGTYWPPYNSLEIVFSRFKKGYMSLIMSNYFNDGSVAQGRILPSSIDGMEDVRFGFHRNFIGFKVLLK